MAQLGALVGALISLAHAQKREASFLVIGDWGWDDVAHGNIQSRACQNLIAESMHEAFLELGDVKFVINVGDSFYPVGVVDKEDPQWDTKWRNVYSSSLRSVPWYSVYGNHDMLAEKSTCSNSESEAAQINYDASNLDRFFMPGFSWFLEHPDLDLEIVALDLNDLWAAQTCPHTSCKESCHASLAQRAEVAWDLFYERMENSNASNMLVFSHYPTDYFWAYPEVLGNLSEAVRPGGLERHVEYFGGHRHNVDQESTTSIKPSNSWLVGGGGGWSCDGRQQGFLVGEIFDDGSMTTRPVLVDYCSCCGCWWWWRP
ncbi:unnamed protein product [Effrenium voratum]|uniref:Calcineurin-like phosphoesterase domain-containing protein n=1 Tax=Effrenium voratum TaxID=2562239 RepID=A0AA36MXJ8_9DINO|nr:unnamed protein product [Effrenium voratum]CAJ1450746.1 unnamed protein product [Effrenium voratum]|eukprot:CAMPEP_0181413932 /NCGR_PEP_ID=MMETSP1110-20121109/9236_1 /TAXON_ID=174948 /ORGANISM="Symbiodinium sp., Strain CCMP421" /LENGTH=314 /DNA_ID=CAMNT_0023536779 /DNA_START=59 /DNA_END=1003 /DNA_ORIENTATION=-